MTAEAAAPRAKPVEHGYPGPQAALCTVCKKFSWLCPHPWELREAGSEWEAFARGLPWKTAKPTTAPSEARAGALEDSEKFSTTSTAPITLEPVRVRARTDDAPPAPRRLHYLCGCTILFTDPWLWKILMLPQSHQTGCRYAENERFVASLRVPVVVEAPQVVIERPTPKAQKAQKREIVSLVLELPK